MTKRKKTYAALRRRMLSVQRRLEAEVARDYSDERPDVKHHMEIFQRGRLGALKYLKEGLRE